MAGPEQESGLAALEERLGHRFADRRLLVQALTHASAVEVRAKARLDNERLEFLGDRVLALVIAEMLLARYPDESEGGLAPRLNALVRRETCAAVATALGLGPALRLGRSEADTGGRLKPALLADACEAVIAALYMDGGLAVARRFIATQWQPFLDRLHAVPQDAKTALQEWAQGRGLAPPLYRLAGRRGPDHAPVFVVAVTVGDLPPVEAEGGSKRAAEQAAAQILLRQIGVWTDGDDRDQDGSADWGDGARRR